MNLGQNINNISVLIGFYDGFVGNRMVHQYGREATFLIEEGALPKQVDKTIYDFGFPMSPFTMVDMAGLDIGWRIRKAKAAARPNNHRYSKISDLNWEQGRFGQKTGAGWYRYEKDDRTPIPDPEIERLIVRAPKDVGIKRREISEEEVLKRCMYPLVNEGAKILEEGLAIRASDIDVIWIYGYGFPRYRGGPMFWADTIGLNEMLSTMQSYHGEHGELMRPARLLERMAKEGRKYSDFNANSNVNSRILDLSWTH